MQCTDKDQRHTPPVTLIMYNLKSAFQLISTNDLEQIKLHLDVLAPFLPLTVDFGPEGEGDDGFNNFTWYNAGGTFLHIENLCKPSHQL